MAINDTDKFLINDGTKTETVTWAQLKADIDVPILSGPNPPQNPSLGDIWIDTADCPPTINIWDDCDDPGTPIWRPIGGGELPACQQAAVQIIGDSELGSTLTASGGGGIDEGTLLPAPTYEWTGAKTGTGETIVADVEGDYTVTATVTCTDGSTLSTSATKTVADSYVDMVNNTSPVIGVLGEGPDGAYEGNQIYVATNSTVINGQNPVIVENEWLRDSAYITSKAVYTINDQDPVGSVITCRQLHRDERNNTILSEVSNEITIVQRPAGAITFTPVITDDGTPEANQPGHVLTASAENIVGGTAPVEYGYKWLVDGLTMGSNKTLNIISTFVGKIVLCEITVAEPDGSNPETRTATYSKIIEVAGTINTPSVLNPKDGAGSGTVRYIKSDKIISVDSSGGIKVDETSIITNVDDTTDAPNIVLELTDDTNLDKFEAGLIVQKQDPSEAVINVYGKDGSLLERSEYVLVGLSTDGTGNTPDQDIINALFFENQGGKTVLAYDRAEYSGDMTTQVPELADLRTFEFVFKRAIQPDDVDPNVYCVLVGGHEVYVDDVYRGKHEAVATGFVDIVNFLPFKKLKFVPIETVYDKKMESSGFCGLRNDSGVYYDFGNFKEVQVVSTDPDAVPPTITVDGGEWLGDDGSGDPDGETTVKKKTTFDYMLTLAGPTDIDSLTDSVYSTDGTTTGGVYNQSPYILTTSQITGVNDSDPNSVALTFADPCPDLQYFQAGDEVQSGVSVISTGYAQGSNTMVVSGGTWGGSDTYNTDKIWSASNSGNLSEVTPVTNIFDGTLSTAGGIKTSNAEFYIDNIGIDNVILVELLAYCTSSTNEGFNKYYVNDLSSSPVDNEDRSCTETDTWTTIYSGPAITLNKITAYAKDNSYSSEIYAVRVNGKILVDTGIFSTHAEYQTNGGEGEIVSINTTDNTLLISNTGDRDNRWIAENKAATDFYVAGPSIVDEPLLTADVELRSTDFATTPENADTLKNIVWELNNVEQNAGLSNPYKPTLNTNTTYTVRVKHQGNSLEDSAWSTVTTFTTGATRNLYTYYKERVELLESRLASIEADEVNDDATDTVLINNVANLLERIEQLEGGA